MGESHAEHMVWSGDIARMHTDLANKDIEIRRWRDMAFTMKTRMELIKDLLADDDPRQAMLIVLASLEDFRSKNA